MAATKIWADWAVPLGRYGVWAWEEKKWKMSMDSSYTNNEWFNMCLE